MRPGDVAVPEGVLRLSVGALAQLARRLEAQDPRELAEAMRALDTTRARHVLASLLRADDADARVARLSDAQVRERVPAAVAVVVEALS